MMWSLAIDTRISKYCLFLLVFESDTVFKVISSKTDLICILSSMTLIDNGMVCPWKQADVARWDFTSKYNSTEIFR